LFSQFAGGEIAFDPQGARYDKSIFPARLGNRAFVPQRLRPVLRKGATVETCKIIGIGWLRAHATKVMGYDCFRKRIRIPDTLGYRRGFLRAESGNNFAANCRQVIAGGVECSTLLISHPLDHRLQNFEVTLDLIGLGHFEPGFFD